MVENSIEVLSSNVPHFGFIEDKVLAYDIKNKMQLFYNGRLEINHNSHTVRYESYVSGEDIEAAFMNNKNTIKDTIMVNIRNIQTFTLHAKFEIVSNHKHKYKTFIVLL